MSRLFDSAHLSTVANGGIFKNSVFFLALQMVDFSSLYEEQWPVDAFYY